MFGNDKLQGFEYKGFVYGYDLDIEPEENCKTLHFATLPNGETLHFDWSPYSNPTEDDFKLWVDCGCPERITNGPLRREDLEYIHGAGLPTWTFDLKSRTSDWSRSGIRVTIGSERLLRELVASSPGWSSCDILNLQPESLT